MNPSVQTVGSLEVAPYLHPQGCRTYVVFDPASKEALLVDPHLDLVRAAHEHVTGDGLTVRWIVDTHTHADHPSGAAPLAQELRATRVAHKEARHTGVTHLPDDEEPLALGDQQVVVRHAPGHTPDHLVLVSDGALFSGDSLFIGGVARTDFLGGDAGQLFDSIHQLMMTLDDETVLYPGHDYAEQTASTIGAERATNPWVRIGDRDQFIKSLTANPPPEPANMAALLRFNKEASDIPLFIDAEETVRLVNEGGAGTVIDVREQEEIEAAHIPGSRHIPMHEVLDRADEVRKTPAPRLLLCKIGQRAAMVQHALAGLGIAGLSVIDGGIMAYVQAGGETAGGDLGAALDAGGCCAAAPPEAE